MLGAGTMVGLSLGTLSCGFPALAHSQSQSQQPPIVQAPGTEASAGQQPTDLQLPGNLRGTVVDGTGAVVAGARVTLIRADQSPPQEALSGDDGQFSFTNVVPGAFQTRITAGGFETQTSSGILHSGETYIAPPSALALANVNTEVQVTVSQAEVAEAQVKAQEKQRVLGVIPNFYVSYVPDAAPLTSKLKFKLAWKTMIDPVTFALVGASAGVQQAQNDFSGYGQGAQGYAKRFGASYADNATSTFIGSAILQSLLKQHPRYFYKGSGRTGSHHFYPPPNSIPPNPD